MAVLRGNIAEESVIKQAAVSQEMLVHSGPAKVFYSEQAVLNAIKEGKVQEGDILVLPYQGGAGAPGMPERGPVGLPTHLLRKGVRDMVRISDARMSGTSYGACVLHVAPEAYAGGPLALVENGDVIEIDVDARILNLDVSADELEARRQRKGEPILPKSSGYLSIYQNQVQPMMLYQQQAG